MTIFSPFLFPARKPGNMAPTPKSPGPKKGKRKKPQPQRNYRRLISLLLLISLLAISLLAAGYVIFFRTVVAGELQQEDVGKGEVGREEGPGETVASPKRDLPKVAIIIDDLGYNEEIAMAFLDLPIELTYSFLPFAPHTKKLARLAHRRGKTVFLHLPLEPKDKNKDPGPGAIYLSDSPEVQREKLEKCLEAVPYAVGVNNHMGSAFTEDREAMTNILKVLAERSMIFLDSYTTEKTVGYGIARKLGVRSYGRAVFLDNVPEEDEICGQLEELVRSAEKNNEAIAIGHPRWQTLRAIEDCGMRLSQNMDNVNIGKRYVSLRNLR
jgi:polysaccharide deacetylase 2 family uncharacterized protein YibQ